MSPCCTGVNGSHTNICRLNTTDRLICWCCGGSFPVHWACLWSEKGSRCFQCEDHTGPCDAHTGCELDDLIHEPRGLRRKFCSYCGANCPPREGEGTCAKCDPEGVRKHQLAQIDKWRQDSEVLRRSNIVEIAVRNETGSVSEYMNHWEGRALRAELKLVEVSSILSSIQMRTHDTLRLWEEIGKLRKVVE